MAANDFDVVALVRACKAAGFAQGKGLVNAVAVSCAEDPAHDLTAVFVNADTWRSRDRGPFQINDHWHAEVTDACAFDLACSAKEAFRISSSGSSFSPWATYTSSKYKQYLELAWTAVALVNALDGELADTAQEQALQVSLDQAHAALAVADANIADLTTQIANLNGLLAGANEAGAIQATKYAEASNKLDLFRAARDAVLALKDV